jgi:uncharacterized membrane protein
LILFGPLFYGASLAAFGTEHFTLSAGISSMVPPWMPWPLFWTYFVGTCFIAAPLSLVTKIQARLAASLLGLTFFFFVVLMDLPALTQDPRDRFSWAVSLRELCFGAGPLALAASLSGQGQASRFFAAVARYVIAVAMLFYSFEQFRHADHVPAIPLEALTPPWIPAHEMWTYLTAVAYAIGGALLLVGWKTRAAATGLSLTVLLVELIVYLPIGIAYRASIDNGLNYVLDTLMFCGTILLFAGALTSEQSAPQRAAAGILTAS